MVLAVVLAVVLVIVLVVVLVELVVVVLFFNSYCSCRGCSAHLLETDIRTAALLVVAVGLTVVLKVVVSGGTGSVERAESK